MQVVKNLFLWPSKSYVRKAIEIPLAYLVEAAWSKRRILEIYLNIAEWGPGIFGAEAAARYHFGKPASLLSPREAALLAVSLPNPFEREAGSPGPGTQRLADNLLLRMRAAPGNASCVRSPGDGGLADVSGKLLWPCAGIAAISPAADSRRLRYRPRPAPIFLAGEDDGRPEEEDVAHEARNPPFGGCAEGADLRRGQGLGRAPASASHRPEIRQISRPPDPGGKAEV